MQSINLSGRPIEVSLYILTVYMLYIVSGPLFYIFDTAANAGAGIRAAVQELI